MTASYFGTDGIRGEANSWPMTAEVALKVGMAAGTRFRGGNHAHRVVIGKDTRLSCYMIENALAAGFIAVGLDVLLIGPIPTPGVARLTRSMRADLGVMISASHNPYTDNGIKLFGPDGYKLSDEVETGIDKDIAGDLSGLRTGPRELGRARRLQGALDRYSEFCKNAFLGDGRLDGLKIVVDGANGAGYRVIPQALWELGADIVPIGISPDGTNINRDCGSTAPAQMQEAVVAHGADLGIAVDGDADRLVIADEKGGLVDGDQILALVADGMLEQDKLSGGGIVGTVMSNVGLERFMQSRGLKLERTSVGDRHIVQRMLSDGYNVGGEPSGHIIFSNHSTTGDALIAALQVLAVFVEKGLPMSELGRQFEPVPQIRRDVPSNGGNPLEAGTVRTALASAQAELAPNGRLVVRRSGTEPLVRIMAEHDDSQLVDRVVTGLDEAIREVAG